MRLVRPRFDPTSERPLAVTVWNDFSGGYWLDKDQTQAKPNNLIVAQNIIMDTDIIEKRKGCVKQTSSPLAGAIDFLHVLVKEDGSVVRIAAIGRGLYKWDGTAIKTDFSENCRFDFENYLDKIYIVNGYDGLWQYDGSSISQVTPYTPSTNEPANELSDTASGIHKSTLITAAINRVYLSGSLQNPSYVWVSQQAMPDYFPVTYTVKVHTGDGQRVRAIKALYNVVVAFKDRSIYAFPTVAPTAADFNIWRVSDACGCPNHRLVVPWDAENALIFVDYGGIYTLKVTERVDIFTLDVLPNTENFLKQFSSVEVAAAQAVVHDNKLIISIGGKWYVYDLRKKVWLGYWTHDHKALLVSGRDLFSGRSDGHILRHAGVDITYTDDGLPIVMKVGSAWMDFDTPKILKHLKEVFVEIGSLTVPGDVLFYIGMDYTPKAFVFGLAIPSDVTGTWDVSNWDECVWAGAEVLSARLTPPPFNGSRIMYSVEHSAAGKCEFCGVIARWRPLSWEGAR